MNQSSKELTLRAVLLGLFLSVVMGAANVYLGLKVGLTVSASIPAAVLALIFLKTFFSDGSILEANLVQTSASAGESLAAGIIFTMPALLLIGAWEQFDMFMTTAIAFTGGLLGILFMIPMRKVFVQSKDSQLKYPEGLACAAVLRSSQSGEQSGSGKVIFWGAGIGLLVKLSSSFFKITHHMLEAAWQGLGGRIFYYGSDISPALVAVGYIIGLNVSLLIFAGGAIGWVIAIPAITGASSTTNALETAWTVWSTQIRYIGVGAIVLGGLSSIWTVRHSLIEAVRQLVKVSGNSGGDESGTERDIPGPAIQALAALTAVLVGIIYYNLTGNVVITVITTIAMIFLSFFFTAVASYIVGLVGNSNSPVSGMTITAVLVTALLITLFGFTGMEGMVATLGVAAIVCCAACTSGDVCNDLKTGQLVGASPYRQQIMQVLGVAIASLVMAPTLQLLHDNTPGGIGGRELAAPQAALFANLVKSFFGDGQIPWDMVGWGVGIGVLILVVDQWLEKNGREFRLHLMPVAIGIYLPFGLATPILLGGLLHHAITKKASNKELASRPGTLFSSGIIAGESLTGIFIALLASIGFSHLNLSLSEGLVEILTLIVAALILYSFYRFSRNKDHGR